MEEKRVYRSRFGKSLETHTLKIGETDLALCLKPAVYQQAEAGLKNYIIELRTKLQAYIASDNQFASTHQPYQVSDDAPEIAQAMAKAASLAGVGPMAAVAGAFAYYAGEYLRQFSDELIVENGGDIYLVGQTPRLVGVFAGKSPFSDKIAIKIPPRLLPMGVCTSSGTVGHSFSYGIADAAVILAPSPLLADAAATAAGNVVKSDKDVKEAADLAAGIEGVCGALIICGKRMAAWGEIEIEAIS